MIAVVSPGVVILLNAVVAVLLLALSRRPGLAIHARSRAALLVAGLPLLSAGVLSLYVFGEDSYRDNGISRWDAHRASGRPLGWVFAVSVAIMVACSAVLAYAVLRRRGSVFSAAALAGGLGSLVLVSATVIGFSGN